MELASAVGSSAEPGETREVKQVQAWGDVADTMPGVRRYRSLPVVVPGGQVPTYRVDTYDIWAQGVPIHTGIPAYDQARESAYGYSEALPIYMFYMFYSGIYGRGRNSPRPLAAFLAGRQLPMPIRLTPSDDIDEVKPARIPLDYRHSLRVVRWGDRSFIYGSSEYGSMGTRG